MIKRMILIVATAVLLMGNMQFESIEKLQDEILYVHSDSANFASIKDPNHYIQLMATRLGVEYSDLFSLINFETGGTMDPFVTNPYTGARGLIQFTNSTSRTLKSRKGRKFADANDLIAEYPEVKDQLELPSSTNRYGGPVYQYLMRNYPYHNSRQLFLTVFYPVALNWDDSRALPPEVTAGNPGFYVVGDYMKLVKRRIVLSNDKVFD